MSFFILHCSVRTKNLINIKSEKNINLALKCTFLGQNFVWQSISILFIILGIYNPSMLVAGSVRKISFLRWHSMKRPANWFAHSRLAVKMHTEYHFAASYLLAGSLQQWGWNFYCLVAGIALEFVNKHLLIIDEQLWPCTNFSSWAFQKFRVFLFR